jgi:hypothetical protein
MNATATAALVFKFCGRNPKMIARWPPAFTTTRRTTPANPHNHAGRG